MEVSNNGYDIARELVYKYAVNHLDKSDDNSDFTMDDVYVVWFCYILGGWKALVSTRLRDGMYYEVTHNIHANVTYFDAYKKFDHKEVHHD